MRGLMALYAQLYANAAPYFDLTARAFDAVKPFTEVGTPASMIVNVNTLHARALAVFVNVVVASLHAHCFNSARGARSGLSQTSFFNSQLRVERDQRCGLLALACA